MPSNITISPNNTPWATNPCNFFWVSLDDNLAPILGTMRSKNNNQYDDMGTPCNEARVTPYQTQSASGYQPCLYPSGLRYYYLVSNSNTIVPNSMISMKGRPSLMCVGTNHYVEYRSYVPTPVNAIVG